MSNEPYCVWCNRIGHGPTDTCRTGASGPRPLDWQDRALAAEARLAEAVEALKRISDQKLSVELSEEEFVEDHEGDFEGGYNSIIEIARAAIKRAVE